LIFFNAQPGSFFFCIPAGLIWCSRKNHFSEFSKIMLFANLASSLNTEFNFNSYSIIIF
jgi:hypothetical protein